MEDRLQRGADKSRTELFKPRIELWEGVQIEPVGSTEEWETVASGQLMQKGAWNRMVTRTMREQPHTTPVTTIWTTDFLTREGEVRKAMGDWLHDNLIPWKTCRCLLQTNSEHFRASHASRNGASTRMGYVVCVSDAERWVWDF
jgi:hypothetical protein